uniref:BTB domain-containing protein n=1 Tax=Panagrellus redivivus TaxID=6233 RepID=A0A7E4UMR4_PANRE
MLYDYSKKFPHSNLKLNCIVNDRVIIVVTATYCVPYITKTDAHSCKLQFQPYEFVDQSCETYDFEIITVEGGRVLAHKGFLSMVSPVLNSMYTHNTKEAQTGVVTIKDFDHAIVNTAVDLLYGRLFEPKTVQDVISMLRFAEKYIIKAVITRLTGWLVENIIVDNLPLITQYAWKHSSEKLKIICARFYRKLTKVCYIDPDIVADMAKLSLV